MEQLYRQDLILGLLPSKENALNIAAIHERVTNQVRYLAKRLLAGVPPPLLLSPLY